MRPNLYSSNDLKRYRLIAADGDIGSIQDVYFAQPYWDVRYLIVNTGTWLDRKDVLISPVAVGDIQREERTIDIELTKRQVENTPAISEHKPISREYEEQYYRYFNWTPYWTSIEMDPLSIPPPTTNTSMPPLVSRDCKDPPLSKKQYLRSESEITGYSIAGRDENIGYVKDLIIDCYYWVIRYLVIDTRKWLPSRTVLLNPARVHEIDWCRQKVSVDRHSLESAPEFIE